MNFELSLYIAGYLSAIILFITLGVYIRRFRRISDQVSGPTRRALVWFAIAVGSVGVLMIIIIIYPSLVLISISFMYAAFFISQLNLFVTNEKKLKLVSIGLIVLAILMSLESFVRSDLITLLGFPVYTLPPIALVAGMIIFVGGTFLLGLYLLKETPSPFTASIFILLILLLTSFITATTLSLTETPEYFIFLIAPFIVAAGVSGSMLRPWRNIISISIGLLALIIGISVAIPAIIDGNTNIWLFAIAAAFAGACTVAPFDFFMRQAVETKAKTPIYIAVTLLFVALLCLTHSTNYAIAFVNAGVWDPLILYMDWIIGVVGVSAFTMAAIASTTTEQVRSFTKEALIGFGAVLIVLGNPYVQDGRWALDILYIAMFAVLIIAFLGFFRVAYQLAKLGSKGVAGRFLAFMFAALGIGLVSMFADMIDIVILVPMLSSAGILLLLSNPRTLKTLRRT